MNGSTRSGGGAVALSGTGPRLALRGGDSEMQVMLDDANPVDGPVEVRAQLIDIGRLTAIGSATRPVRQQTRSGSLATCRARSSC